MKLNGEVSGLKVFVVLALAVSLVVIAGCAGEAPKSGEVEETPTGQGEVGGEATATSTTTSTPTATPTTTPTSKVVVEYSATRKDKIGSGTFADTPDEGNEYLILDVTVTNEGYEEVSTNPYNFQVIVNNQKRDQAFVTNLDNEMENVGLMDGGTQSGKIAFEVPEGTTDYELLFEPGAGFVDYNIEYVEK